MQGSEMEGQSWAQMRAPTPVHFSFLIFECQIASYLLCEGSKAEEENLQKSTPP